MEIIDRHKDKMKEGTYIAIVNDLKAAYETDDGPRFFDAEWYTIRTQHMFEDDGEGDGVPSGSKHEVRHQRAILREVPQEKNTAQHNVLKPLGALSTDDWVEHGFIANHHVKNILERGQAASGHNPFGYTPTTRVFTKLKLLDLVDLSHTRNAKAKTEAAPVEARE